VREAGGGRGAAELAAKGRDYDPTYSSHNNGRSDDFVRVGPWDGAGTSLAVTVIALPGLLPPMNDRLIENGGWFSWEFVTLLVCAQDPANQDQYLSSAKVQALMHYYVLRSYIKGDPNPEIRVEEVRAAPIGGAVYYGECQASKRCWRSSTCCRPTKIRDRIRTSRIERAGAGFARKIVSGGNFAHRGLKGAPSPG
jgi:hypothetical protein